MQRTSSYVNLSGSERIERLRNLAKEGNNVYLVAADFEKEQYQTNSNLHLISIPTRYFPVLSSIAYGLALFLLLPAYLVRIRPDFIICDPSTALFLSWKPILSKLLKFRVTLDIRSTPVRNPTAGAQSYLSRIAFNISVHVAKKMFDGMTIITPMMRDEICQEFNIDPEWVGILSGGVSDGFLRFEKESFDKMELRKKFGLSDKFVILYHGSLRMRTGGLIETIKAVALLKKAYPDITFLILAHASRSGLHLLETTIKENGVKDYV